MATDAQSSPQQLITDRWFFSRPCGLAYLAFTEIGERVVLGPAISRAVSSSTTLTTSAIGAPE